MISTIGQTARTATVGLTVKSVEGKELVHHSGKIYTHSGLTARVLGCYHTMLVHPGEIRMKKSIILVYT